MKRRPQRFAVGIPDVGRYRGKLVVDSIYDD